MFFLGDKSQWMLHIVINIRLARQLLYISFHVVLLFSSVCG